jgi:hypothetical protein
MKKLKKLSLTALREELSSLSSNEQRFIVAGDNYDCVYQSIASITDKRPEDVLSIYSQILEELGFPNPGALASMGVLSSQIQDLCTRCGVELGGSFTPSTYGSYGAYPNGKFLIVYEGHAYVATGHGDAGYYLYDAQKNTGNLLMQNEQGSWSLTLLGSHDPGYGSFMSTYSTSVN